MDAVKFVEARRRMFAMTGENPKYSLLNMGIPAADVVREVEKMGSCSPTQNPAGKIFTAVAQDVDWPIWDYTN